MLRHLNHNRLLRIAGLFTWAVIGVPLLMLSLAPAERLGEGGALIAIESWPTWGAWAVFGMSYAWLTRGLGERRIRAFDHLLVLLLAGSAIGISYYSQSGLGSILLMVVACVLPWLLPLWVGVALLVACEFVIVPVYVRGFDFTWVEAVLQAALYVGFTGFAFVTGFVARQQAQAREEQRRLNAELRATRALLAESVRVNERTRISRELHDLLGHHLTALSLNLEIASHLASGQAQEHVNQAQTLAKLLLSDVREAVSQLRDDDAIDMRATLLPLAEHVPSLQVDMQLPVQFVVDDPERAHVLLRCTQEIITNAVRHSGASLLRLRYSQDADAVRLDARDDGRGAEVTRAGNGLTGMRERLAAYGGSLQVETAPDRGFVLRLELPLADATGLRDAARRGRGRPA
ncbi:MULTISPECIES: sensor histidine kinase [Luteimonas]|uniref:Two-component sensor histidine kinase n=1 Tax=Luteimonas chenhongjianii TaxID=2006110 RepID=A0A290XGF9_9GAMM|nr:MULTISPECIES: sensor histidine kinase [Luteimonas]ATD68026.1 two-component sensor histidine kinase [Luteimonas chenhongjianii]RPD88311.1 sensor histidine kinase [Luteimonas sp. 100069]